MPKESVYAPPTITALEEAEKAGKPARLAQKRKVSVGWSRDMYVQIGVCWVDETRKPEDMFNPERAIGETDEDDRVWESQWLDLDRHGINELIRKLRRARDAAFGRDE